MSRNLNQIPTQAMSILATDKMYIARSPFDVTSDRYILGSDIISQVGSPLVLKGDLYGFSTLNDRLPVAVGDGKILQVSSGAPLGLAYSAPTYPSTSGTLGKIIVSDGTNNVYSTSVWPNNVGPANSIIISNGTSNLYSNSLWPNTVGTALHILLSDGTSNVYSTPAYPNASVTPGKFIISDGTNYIASNSIMPNTVGAVGKIIRSDGTVNAYSTSTFADTYLVNTIPFASTANAIAGATLTSIIDAAIGAVQGNVIYRNATTWVALAPGVSGQFLQTGGINANVLWAGGNSGSVTSVAVSGLAPLFTTLVTNPSTTPSVVFTLSNAAPNTYFGNATAVSSAPSHTAAAALTSANDGNITLTLSGAPNTALLTPATLTLGWSGLLPLVRGGTNADLSTQASNGGIVWSNATQMQIIAGTATAGQMLRSGSTAAPSWSTATWPTTTTANQLLYSSFNNVVAGLASINGAALTTSATGVPTWLAGGTSGNILTFNGTIWTSSPPAGTPSSTSVIVDDTTTNANMYPTWVTANSGALPLKVTSTKLFYSPSTSLLTNIGALAQITNIQSAAGQPVLVFGYTPSAVNYFTIFNNTTGATPALDANGADASIGLALRAKNSFIGLFDNTSTIAPSLRFYNKSGNQYTGFKAADMQATTVNFTLPAIDATVSGQALISNAAGGLSFSTTPISTAPVNTVFTAGSGSYTTPVNVLWLEVEVVGSGAGGSSSGTAATASGTAGNNTTFGTLNGNGGAASSTYYIPGFGGGATGGNINIPGGGGGGGAQLTAISTAQLPGGTGGNSYFGGGGAAGAIGKGAGGNGGTNSGGGGGGGGIDSTSGSVSAGGGGAGGYAKRIIIPTSGQVFAYVVGAVANGAVAGTNGAAGGNGAAGIITLTAHYQ